MSSMQTGQSGIREGGGEERAVGAEGAERAGGAEGAEGADGVEGVAREEEAP